MKKVSLLLTSLVLVTVCASALVMGSPVLAARNTTLNDICNGIDLTGGSSNCGDQGAGVNHAATVLINVRSAIIGLVAVIMVIGAGVQFVTSGGEAPKVAGAKSALIYAIIGLVVVALAQLLVHTVINSITK